ncbi:hypothetical protein AB3X96_29380 [Paraburkholderia sp. BR13439]|uniref:hypothetical protein n=1 Tax=Paraburkholderia TaxID=1822464 RepID=UPI0034CDF2F9
MNGGWRRSNDNVATCALCYLGGGKNAAKGSTTAAKRYRAKQKTAEQCCGGF